MLEKAFLAIESFKLIAGIEHANGKENGGE